MRRGFSIFLILFFSLGPLAATLQAEDESRLPACCRRHGAHHCAMAAMASQAASGDKAIFTAPATCPYFPGYAAGPISTTIALAASPAGLPVVLAQGDLPSAGRTAVPAGQIRTRASRGPPASNLS
jgi:hypothetical protein